MGITAIIPISILCVGQSLYSILKYESGRLKRISNALKARNTICSYTHRAQAMTQLEDDLSLWIHSLNALLCPIVWMHIDRHGIGTGIFTIVGLQL
jgi:hypothetical protein